GISRPRRNGPPNPSANAPVIAGKNDGTITIRYGEASVVAVGSPVTPEGMVMAALTQAVKTEINRRRGLNKSIDKLCKRSGWKTRTSRHASRHGTSRSKCNGTTSRRNTATP
ncbi:hypothetical protein OC842_007671, partial [Tilletia horrida]